jgi:hypothetical protein
VPDRIRPRCSRGDLKIADLLYRCCFIAAIIGYLGYRWLARGERGSNFGALTAMAGES